jgi:hypothetical protein
MFNDCDTSSGATKMFMSSTQEFHKVPFARNRKTD